jgi:hypothetical protein
VAGECKNVTLPTELGNLAAGIVLSLSVKVIVIGTFSREKWLWLTFSERLTLNFGPPDPVYIFLLDNGIACVFS